MSALLSLIYVSNSTRLLSREELAQILAGARERNQQAGITGLLLYSDGNFMQYLEGPHAAVEATFERILNNPAHSGIIQVQRKEITQREFDDASMAYWTPSLNRFVSGNRGEVLLDPDVAFNTIRDTKTRALLNGFHNRNRLDNPPPLPPYSHPVLPPIPRAA